MLKYIIFFQLLFFFSCTNNKVKDKTAAFVTQETTPVKVTVLADLPDNLRPETILLENTPEPKTIKITDKPVAYTINHKSGPHTLTFGPIEKTKASFTPALQNYTTEHGLALDVMSTGF